MPKKLKVAVVMRGGWSLGAFTGGAIWELVRQLHGNRQSGHYDRCEIDVLVGSGAGALTLAVLLRTLANPEGFMPSDAVARVGEAQRAAWLEGMDFTRLMRSGAMRKPALLDRQAVDELATELLSWPDGDQPNAVLLGRRVLFGVPLLNFNGIPIRGSQLPALPDTVNTTMFCDHRVFCFDFGDAVPAAFAHWRHFDSVGAATAESWHEVAATAVASGAFPIAFEPVVLQRYREEYGVLWPGELSERDEFPFTFGDGGPFQHEPLREAMSLISAQDALEQPGSFDRLLVFIDPNLSGSKHAFGLKFHIPYMESTGRARRAGDDVVPSDPAAHLVAITNRYGVLARHQSMFEDLVSAARVNARCAWRTELRSIIAGLGTALESTGAAGRLADEAETRLACMLKQEAELTAAPSAPTLAVREAIAQSAFEQTGEQLDVERVGDADRLAYTLMALVDQIADLRGKEPVRVLVVAPTELPAEDGAEPVPVRLAGDFFANFGGFFDARFRVHDFEAGRVLAASALAGESLLADPAERPEYRPWTDRAPSLEAVPAARDRFVRRIAELTRQLLEYKIGYLGVSQAISIVANYVTPRLVRDTGPQRRTAIVRIEVTSVADGVDLSLAGAANGDRGGDVRRVDDVVMLHSVLHYSDTDIIGPHVIALPDGPAIRLVERGSRQRNRFLDIPLPGPAGLRAHADYGLPIHHTRVDWSTRTTSGWTQEDALQEWPGGYPL